MKTFRRLGRMFMIPFNLLSAKYLRAARARLSQVAQKGTSPSDVDLTFRRRWFVSQTVVCHSVYIPQTLTFIPESYEIFS